MSILFQCEKCHQRLEAEDDMSGLNIDCPKCGKQILIGLSIVPEPTPPISRIPPSQTTPSSRDETSGTPKTSGLAIASMVIGILGIVGGWICCGILLPILAIIFGHIAYSRISRQPHLVTGQGFAIAGFTMGYVGLAFAIVMFFTLGTFTVLMSEGMKQFDQIIKQTRLGP